MSNIFLAGQQQMLQNIPYHQLVHNELNPNQVNLVGISMSANMAPYYGLVLTQAINEVQGKRSASAPRVFFFNVMAINNFDNNQFRAYLQELAKIVEQVCIAQNQIPQDVLPQVTEAYTSYSVAKLALTNQMLCQALAQQSPQTLQAIQANIGDFENMLRGMLGNRGGFGGNAGTVNMNAGSNTRGAAFNGNSGSVFQGAGIMGGGFSNSSNNGVFSVPSAGSGGQVNENIFGKSTVAHNTPSVQVMNTAGANAISSFQSPNLSGVQDVSAKQATPGSQPQPQVTQVGDTTNVIWTPSIRYPVLPTFDPNREELKFLAYSDGSIQPLIAQKVNMDRNAHLAPLSITPKWAILPGAPGSFLPATEESAKKAEIIITADDVMVMPYPDNVETSLTHKESWLTAEAYMLATRSKYLDKALMVQKYAMLADTLLASHQVQLLIANLHNTSAPQEAAALLAAAYKQAVESENYLDVRAILRIVRRLADRVNRFVRLQMSLPYGTIDDYIEDVGQLAGFFKDKMGEAAGNLFEANHKLIVNEALDVAVDDMAESITQCFFGKSEFPPSEDLYYLHLVNNVVYAVIDLSSSQLRAQIPEAGHSAMVSDSSTPLLAFLAQSLFNKKSAQSKGGAGYSPDRFVLRTNDGVALEFAKGAFATGSTMVGKYLGSD